MFGVHYKFGFGCMRLPQKDGGIDLETFSRMVDEFLANGFNYFDTAHGYHGGKSEVALCECLTKRYPREQYILTDKLSTFHFDSEEEIRPLFETQLQTLGVEYLDFYLMHAQDEKIFEKYKKCSAYETALELKKEGKVKHVGLSFHDKAEVLDRILTEYPEMEVVQIQLNYLDFEDPAVQSKKCYEVAQKHGKPVIVMEPVKGGNLADLPDDAAKVFDALGSASYASYALRFAAGLEGVLAVLSGMSDLAMTCDNIRTMKDFRPLDEKETAAVEEVCRVFRGKNLIPCTACRYCTEKCPRKIPIPDLFACMNAYKNFHNWNNKYYYNLHTASGGKASSCVGCGNCEYICPQHLPVRSLLKEVAEAFES